MNDATFSASFLRLTPVVQPMLTISKLPATGLCFLMNAAISLKSEGCGNPSGSLRGSTPSHRAARLKGRCLGHDPPTQMGILGRCLGVGRESGPNSDFLGLQRNGGEYCERIG